MRTIRLLVIMICLTAATAQARVKDSGHQLTMVQGGEATNDVQQELPTTRTSRRRTSILLYRVVKLLE